MLNQLYRYFCRRQYVNTGCDSPDPFEQRLACEIQIAYSREMPLTPATELFLRLKSRAEIMPQISPLALDAAGKPVYSPQPTISWSPDLPERRHALKSTRPTVFKGHHYADQWRREYRRDMDYRYTHVALAQLMVNFGILKCCV
jgi:hypothetical protein